jgi:anti-sigma regulatory factor (Ser/Thr protein kinase)
VSVAGFRHEAMLYEGEHGFMEEALPFLREGIARDEPALVAVAPERIALLREALGPRDARHVRFEDMRRIGANPARIIPAWHEFVTRSGGRPLRGIGEPVWAERSAAELAECHRHESLLNVAFADAPDFRLLCPYDTAALDPLVVEEARRSHPLVSERGRVGESGCFHGLEAAAEPCSAPLPPAPAWADELAIDARGLPVVRAAVTRHAVRAGLAPGRIEDLVLAVNELATNSVVHGGGCGVLRVWRADSGALVCEVRDDGTLADPLAGRRRPGDETGGCGLWLVNQLCDLVQQRTPAGGGNVVRVTMGAAGFEPATSRV